MRLLFLHVESDKDTFFKVVKVPESKGITLDVFDEFVGCLQFGVRIRKLNSVYDVLLVVKDSSQSCFKGLIEMW